MTAGSNIRVQIQVLGVCVSVYFTYMVAGREVLADAHEPPFDFDIVYFLVLDSS